MPASTPGPRDRQEILGLTRENKQVLLLLLLLLLIITPTYTRPDRRLAFVHDRAQPSISCVQFLKVCMYASEHGRVRPGFHHCPRGCPLLREKQHVELRRAQACARLPCADLRAGAHLSRHLALYDITLVLWDCHVFSERCSHVYTRLVSNSTPAGSSRCCFIA